MQRLGKSWNPFDWLKATQNWFSKTERSSGFRPYLIFLIIHIGLVFALLTWFSQITGVVNFAVNSLYVTFGAFILIFAFKAIQDPDFCRSEKHIETVKRIELTEQKGDAGPVPIDISTMTISSNPTGEPSLLNKSGGVK